MHRVIAVVFVVALAASAALGSFSGTDTFIASTGRGAGSGGSQWYTTVWVHNPDASTANVQFTFLLRNQTNPASPYVYNDTIPAGDTKRYDNAVATMFGLTSAFGAIHAVADRAVIINSRIYSTPSGEEDSNSVGQFFAAVPASFAIANGQTTQLLGVYQTTPTVSSLFRYNYGFVETTGAGVTVRVTVFDSSGAEVTHKDYTLGAYEVRQYGFVDEFPGTSTTNARLQVAVTAGSGKVVAFGSGLANTSNDPSTFEMSFDSSLLAAGLDAVAHDATLIGDGTSGNPLGVAEPLALAAPTAAFQAVITGTSSSGDGYGVLGTGAGYAGVWGESTRSNGAGVHGRANGGTAASGVFGDSTSGDGLHGTSSSGNGVYAWSGSGNGLYAQSTSAHAVYAKAVGSTAYGVYGLQGAASGTYDSNRRGGLWGDSTDGQGVLGTSKNSVGIAGQSLAKTAVQGLALGGGSQGVGVLGANQGGAAWAGYFTGAVYIAGPLTKPAGSFMIDHPTDPAGKYLYHSFVESPDMMNIYNGTITTNADGEAVVQLPDWFGALNRDFRYQLTVIGEFAQAIIGKEIADNRFTIRTDKPNVKVSWQVTGIRQDAYANAHRIPLEVVKPPAEQGTYLHPIELGQPASKSIEWVRDPDLMQTITRALGTPAE